MPADPLRDTPGRRPARRGPADRAAAAAVAGAGAATGLWFVNDGRTAEAASRQRQAFQPDRYSDRWTPVLLVWETADEQPDFGVDVAGQPDRISSRGVTIRPCT